MSGMYATYKYDLVYFCQFQAEKLKDTKFPEFTIAINLVWKNLLRIV